MRNPLVGLSHEEEGFRCKVGPDGLITMEGTLQTRTPSRPLADFLKQIHETSVQARLSEVRADVTQLVHVNSSSLFLFIDWARWIAAVPAASRYMLTFLVRPGVSWQHMMLPTMQRICSGNLRLIYVT